MVDLGNIRVLRVIPLERRAEDGDDLTRAGVHMPLGAEVCGLVSLPGGQIGVTALCEITPARVWHPIWVAVMDQPIAPTLGRSLGPPLGLVPIGGKPTALIPDLPWPTVLSEAPVIGRA